MRHDRSQSVAVWFFSCGAVVVLMASVPAARCGRAFARSAPQQTPATVQDAETAKAILERQGILARGGAGARQARETAVSDLLGMDVLKAHQVLQEWVGPGSDPNGVRKLVLSQLAAKLRSSIDPVFARGTNRDMIQRCYVPRLARHFDGHPPANEALAVLRGLARESLIALDATELGAALEPLLADKNPVTRALALRAAGQSRKPELAVRLARHLDDKAVCEAAQVAVHNLTYERLQSLQAVEQWWEENKHRTYLDLAEQAARNAVRRREDRLEELRTRHVATLVELVEVLATSVRDDRWKRLHTLVFASDPPGLTAACLRRLAVVLGERNLTANGAQTHDRTVFFDELGKRMDEGAPPLEYALQLEVASYLVAPGEVKQRAAQERRLLDALDHNSLPVRLAALRGLRRFFAPSTRVQVVAAAAAALRHDDAGQLRVAVATLQSPGWLAPNDTDKDRDAWVQTLRSIVARDALEVDLRVEAVKAMCLPCDAKGTRLEAVFSVLLQELARPTLTTKLRTNVMVRLPELIPAAPGLRRDTAASQYLDQLVKLQQDKDPNIRRDAARLMRVPDDLSNDQAKLLGDKLWQGAGERLVTEVDSGVYSALLGALRNLAADEQHVAAVNTRLRVALDALRDDEAAKPRVAQLVTALVQVAVNDKRSVIEWFKTCERLLARPLRDRASVRTILAHHLERDGGKRLQAEPSEELRYKVWRLVIDTAVLREAPETWSDPRSLDEAKTVVRACKAVFASERFAKDRVVIDTVPVRLTYLRCLAAAGEAVVLESQAGTWLKAEDTRLAGRDRDEARLLLAEGLRQQGQLAAAWKTAGGAGSPGELQKTKLQLTERIANDMLGRKMQHDAVPLLEELLAQTKQDTADYWPRLRRYLEVRFQVESKHAGELIQRLDAWRRTRPELPAEVRKEVDALRAQLTGRANPPR